EPSRYARLAAEVSTRHSPLDRVDMTLMLDTTGGDAPRVKTAVKVNGTGKRGMGLVGLIHVVLFLPRDLTLVEGSPSDRRRFMNDSLAQVDHAYLEALSTYEKVLPQRNALLRRIADNLAAPHELDYWDAQLIKAGSVLIAGRQRFLRELEADAQKAHHDLTGNRETLTLEYLPSFTPTAEANGQLSFNATGLDLHRE